MNTMLWQRLAARAVEGTLSKEESRKLLAMCRESAEAREALVRVLAMERLLPLVASDPVGTLTAQEVALRLEGGRDVSIEIAWRATERVRRWLWRQRLQRFAAYAAAVALLALAGWWLVRAFTPAAAVSGMEALRWKPGSSIVTASGDFSRGTRLQAEAGLLELEFHSGARMVLEAPFDVELRDGLHAYLHEGRLSVRCPHTAKGFTVETVLGKVVDMGTEFGVEMVKDGAMDVQVLSGRVDATTASGDTTPLLEGEELQIFDHGRTVRGLVKGGQFVTALPGHRNREPEFIHWSLDEGAGFNIANTGHGLGMEADATLHLLAYPERRPVPDKGPQWIDGVFGPALRFDGRTGFGETDFRGISGQSPRTVALWVRVPRDVKDPEGFGIVSWGMPRGSGAWQVSANTNSAQGPLGCLRLGTYDGGVIVGSTDLRDNAWHHVAVVMYGGVRPTAPSNVLLYVDGRLEVVSRKALKEIDTETFDASHGVWVGRNIVYPDRPDKVNPSAKFFRGDMDEIYIFDDALTHDEIARLMHTNQPPGS